MTPKTTLKPPEGADPNKVAQWERLLPRLRDAAHGREVFRKLFGGIAIPVPTGEQPTRQAAPRRDPFGRDLPPDVPVPGSIAERYNIQPGRVAPKSLGRSALSLLPLLAPPLAIAQEPLEAFSEQVFEAITQQNPEREGSFLSRLIDQPSQEFRERPFLAQLGLGAIDPFALAARAPATAARAGNVGQRIAAGQVRPQTVRPPRSSIGAPPRAQLALPPGSSRTAEGAIQTPGRVPPAPRVAQEVVEPSLVIVTPQRPLGERLIFSSQRNLNRAAQELSQRSEVQLLPGTATPRDVDRAASLIQREMLPGQQTTIPVTRGGEQIVEPRPFQRQFQRGLDPDNLDAMRRNLRSIENEINTTTPGPRPNSPVNQRLRELRQQATALRANMDSLIQSGLPPELDIPGVVRREPITRVTPSTQGVLGPGFIRGASQPGVRSGVAQRAVSRGDVPSRPIEVNASEFINEIDEGLIGYLDDATEAARSDYIINNNATSLRRYVLNAVDNDYYREALEANLSRMGVPEEVTLFKGHIRGQPVFQGEFTNASFSASLAESFRKAAREPVPINNWIVDSITVPRNRIVGVGHPEELEVIVQLNPVGGPVARPRGDIAQRAVSRGNVPFEASTPQEAAQFRARIRSAPEPGQLSFVPEPEQVVTRPQAQSHIFSEFYDAVQDSPTDIAATAYMRTGKIQNFIDRIPEKFDVAKGFADEVFKEVGRVSAQFADPTRLIQAIDFGYFGNALQRGLMWPTRRTFMASLNWGDATKVDYRKMLDRHGIRGVDPIRTRQKLDAAGDVLERIGTNEVNVSVDVLNSQMDDLLRKFSSAERIQIVGVAKDNRILFDSLLDIQNAARRKRGQSDIAKLQNYRPWLRNTSLWARAGFSNQSARQISQSIPPPDFIKPNEVFNPRALRRIGGLEDFEKIRNIEKLTNDYIETARKDIFYTNIIQNAKAHIKGLRSKGIENSAEAVEDWIYESFTGRAPAFTKFARKSVVSPILNPMMALRRSLTRSVFPLNWTWNFAIQTSSIALTIKNHGLTSTLQGLEYLTNPTARKQVREVYSAFIKRRSGGKFTRQDLGGGTAQTDRLERSAVETVEGWANLLTNLIEDNLTGISVRAAHHDGVRRGLKGRALAEFSSEGGSKTQSMYNLEDVPGILRNKEIGAIVPFQTFAFEVFNTVRELGFPLLGRTGSFKTHNNRMLGLARWFSAMAALNIASEKINNRQPWQLSSFIPFWSVMLMGADAGNSWNLPLPIKYGADFKKGITDYLKHGNWTKLRSWAIRYHMLGGIQINRTLLGIEAVADGEVSDVSGRKLFDVRPDEWKKAVSQGVYSTSEGKEYVDKINESKGPIFKQTRIPLPSRPVRRGETPPINLNR